MEGGTAGKKGRREHRPSQASPTRKSCGEGGGTQVRVQTCAQQCTLHGCLWYFLGLGRPENEYSSHGPSGPSSLQLPDVYWLGGLAPPPPPTPVSARAQQF